MKKWAIGAILSLASAAGIFFYTQSADKRFADSLSEPTKVQPSTDKQTEAAPEHTTDLDTVVFDTTTIIEENADPAETTSVDDAAQVADQQPVEASEKAGDAWKNDDDTEKPSTADPSVPQLDINEMDPDELADMLLVGLIEQFGDIPEVRIFMEFRRKMFKNEPITLDERIAFTEAQLYLWPDPRTEEALEGLLESRESQSSRSTRTAR